MKKMRLIIPIILIFCCCCTNTGITKTNSNKLGLLYLWGLDSVENISKKIMPYDLLFFEENQNFWRINTYKDDYLIDSCGYVEKQSVIINNKVKYKIEIIEKDYMALIPKKGTTHYYKKVNYSKKSDLTDLLYSRNQNLLLAGSWVLKSTELNPTTIPSFCKGITSGAIFVFKEGFMSVYPIPDEKKCYAYPYGIYENKLEFSEWDFGLEFGIKNLTKDSLILISHFERDYKKNDTIFAKDMILTEKGYSLKFIRK